MLRIGEAAKIFDISIRTLRYWEDEAILNSTRMEDVLREQEKINRSDAIVFIYPIFWIEAPARLVGWFNRVWTCEFAYGERTMKKLAKAIMICIAGHTTKILNEYSHLESMKKVMLGNRIFDRAYDSKMIVLDGMSKQNYALREINRHIHLLTAYKKGYDI
jgi:NAD(P)H dehydrogenase (quinone)